MKKILTTCLMTLALSTPAHALEPSAAFASWLTNNPSEIIQGVAKLECHNGKALSEQMLLTYLDFYVDEDLSEYSESAQTVALHLFSGAFLWEYFQLCNSEGA